MVISFICFACVFVFQLVYYFYGMFFVVVVACILRNVVVVVVVPVLVVLLFILTHLFFMGTIKFYYFSIFPNIVIISPYKQRQNKNRFPSDFVFFFRSFFSLRFFYVHVMCRSVGPWRFFLTILQLFVKMAITR